MAGMAAITKAVPAYWQRALLCPELQVQTVLLGAHVPRPEQ